MKPTIYGFAPSTYTQTALLTAAEVGADVEVGPLEFKQASHLAKHPYGKMPAFEHDDVRLFETLAIATYLDRAFGNGRLSPADSVQQATMLQWISVAIDYAYEDLVNGLHGDDTKASAITAACEQLALLDAGLGQRRFFAGDAITLADLFLYPMIEYASQKLDSSGLKHLKALNRWRKLMAQRPSTKQVKSA